MRTALAVLLASHALIHLMGFLEAFGFVEFQKLVIPISKPMGLVWLVAMFALLAAAAAVFVAPGWFWLVGAFGVLLSQIAITSSWGDAKFGTVLNLLILFAVVHGAFSRGPFGLHAAYDGRVRLALSRVPTTRVVTEADLVQLPAPVQRYLRFVGVVGSPQVYNYRVSFVGRIRSGAETPWMPFTAEQYSFVDGPTRLFMMDATMKGLPVDVFHSYTDAQARMQVKVLSLYPMTDVSGFDMTTAETVTVFNDMCVMAPATLISRSISWKTIDDRTVEGTFTTSAHTIRAVLYFDDTGALVNFTSDDRPGLGPDGKTLIPQRWSTPLSGYRQFGGFRLASRAATRYAPASGEFTYGEFAVHEVEYNVGLE